MAFTKFKKRNVNRFKKIYPFVQRTPREKYMSDKEVLMETARVTVSNTDNFRYYLTETLFKELGKTPTITVSVRDNVPTDDSISASVTLVVDTVTTEYVDVSASHSFIGSVYLQAIWIEGE